jgi:hypothetical protein
MSASIEEVASAGRSASAKLPSTDWLPMTSTSGSWVIVEAVPEDVLELLAGQAETSSHEPTLFSVFESQSGSHDEHPAAHRDRRKRARQPEQRPEQFRDAGRAAENSRVYCAETVLDDRAYPGQQQQPGGGVGGDNLGMHRRELSNEESQRDRYHLAACRRRE